MNRFLEGVYLIPEDDADRQIADGFILHPRVKETRIKVLPPAGGWPNVLRTFQDEYIRTLQQYPLCHVVMLIDFDDQVERRSAEFERAIPEDLKSRVFVVGPKENPETLKKALKTNFEGIGMALACECDGQTTGFWDHEQLRHNDAERLRLFQTVKPFLFVWINGSKYIL